MMDYRTRVVFLTFFYASRVDTDKVVGQSEPVVATVGDDVILPCTLRNTVSTVSAVDESVEWQRPDLHPKEVHFYRSRGDYNDDQNPSYTGRTSLFKEEEIKNGNVSLKLTSVKLSDAGNYICFIPTLKSPDQKASVQLIVGAASQWISIVGVDLMGVVLECEAVGLMYIPEMTWLDSDGTILPAGPTETETDSEGRYTVRGHVTIQKTDNNTITCRVLQQEINHKMETQFHVPDGMFPEPCQSWWSVWWRGWWVGGLTWGLIVLVVGSVVLSILKIKGLLHCGRGVLNRDSQTNGTSQWKGNALPNGNAQTDAMLPDDDSGV